MMLDISSREDIERLVGSFYERATKDVLIGHYFTSVIPINWDEHIPTIVSFWENILFKTGGYSGGMMYKHMNLNYLSAFKTIHFDRWLEIWELTVDELFAGVNAEEVKFRARTIAVIMQTKIGVYKEDTKK
ncbi:group III truncated hemoglobin [Olivibacter domesticus]|uniref:Hemoglobin n=1 Tax=Olivibacter domesticus TaxID=407022 RepID=A0A1H7RY55_OLID1|nr:group III truncated hemoglobin [Olivibacter domesticus]SEL65145.1 hemoglobin [Olivibacter domesticus]